MQNRLQGVRRLTLEEREEIRAKRLRLKDKHELQYAGGFERIFPLPEAETDGSESAAKQQELYDTLVEANHAVFGEQAAGGGVCAKPKIDEILRGNLNKIKGGSSAAKKKTETP